MDHLCVGYLSPPLLIFMRVITTSEPVSEVPIPHPPLGSLVSHCGVSHFALPRLVHAIENGTCDMLLGACLTTFELARELSHHGKMERKKHSHRIYNKVHPVSCTPVWIRTLTHNTLTHTALHTYTYQDVFNPYLFAVILS